jgi:large subunit ribosomal protein L10
MAHTDKTAALAGLEAGFRESNAALLTEYRGLTVAQLKQLRRSIAADAEYAVVKNTLTKLAAKRAGVEGLDDLLEGPSAIAFVKGDAITVAKALKNFAKEFPLLVIKGGYFDGKVVTADEVKKLADLETREVLLSKVAGVLMATLSKAVRTIDALRASLEDGTEKPSEPVATEAAAPAAVEEVVAEEASAPAPAEVEVEAVESAEPVEAPAEETAETTEA